MTPPHPPTHPMYNSSVFACCHGGSSGLVSIPFKSERHVNEWKQPCNCYLFLHFRPHVSEKISPHRTRMIRTHFGETGTTQHLQSIPTSVTFRLPVLFWSCSFDGCFLVCLSERVKLLGGEEDIFSFRRECMSTSVFFRTDMITFASLFGVMSVDRNIPFVVHLAVIQLWTRVETIPASSPIIGVPLKNCS